MEIPENFEKTVLSCMKEVVSVLAKVMRRDDLEIRSHLEMLVQALHNAKAQFSHIYADACACCKEIIY